MKLPQEFRSFDFLSPWEGAHYAPLPGDEKAATKDKRRTADGAAALTGSFEMRELFTIAVTPCYGAKVV